MTATNTQFSVAVHILASIAKVGAQSSSMLAHTVNTSPIFLKRILAKLSKAGLLVSSPGRSGGSDLARAAHKITLFDVYLAVESPKAFAIHEYPKVKACDISSNIKETMGGILDDVQLAVEKKLRSKTISDLLKDMNIRV